MSTSRQLRGRREAEEWLGKVETDNTRYLMG